MAKKNTATFLGPNLGLSVAGDFAYAYSGLVVTTDAEVTLLEFTTGNYTVVCKVQFLYAAAADTTPNANSFYTLQMNGNTIISYLDFNETIKLPAGPFDLIIPPNTTVKATAELGETATQNQACLIVGKIFNA